MKFQVRRHSEDVMFLCERSVFWHRNNFTVSSSTLPLLMFISVSDRSVYGINEPQVQRGTNSALFASVNRVPASCHFRVIFLWSMAWWPALSLRCAKAIIMASDCQILKLNPPVGAILTLPEGECLTLSLLWNCKLCFRCNAVLVQSRKWDLP